MPLLSVASRPIQYPSGDSPQPPGWPCDNIVLWYFFTQTFLCYRIFLCVTQNIISSWEFRFVTQWGPFEKGTSPCAINVRNCVQGDAGGPVGEMYFCFLNTPIIHTLFAHTSPFCTSLRNGSQRRGVRLLFQEVNCNDWKSYGYFN